MYIYHNDNDTLHNFDNITEILILKLQFIHSVNGASKVMTLCP